jgi:hypothetical protein
LTRVECLEFGGGPEGPLRAPQRGSGADAPEPTLDFAKSDCLVAGVKRSDRARAFLIRKRQSAQIGGGGTPFGAAREPRRHEAAPTQVINGQGNGLSEFLSRSFCRVMGFKFPENGPAASEIALSRRSRKKSSRSVPIVRRIESAYFLKAEANRQA